MRKKVGVLPHDIFAKGFFKGCHHNINLVYRLTGTFFHIPTILECAILNVSIKMYVLQHVTLIQYPSGLSFGPRRGNMYIVLLFYV